MQYYVYGVKTHDIYFISSKKSTCHRFLQKHFGNIQSQQNKYCTEEASVLEPLFCLKKRKKVGDLLPEPMRILDETEYLGGRSR
ncbi:hypothetical protein [Catellicoccus marimammalium]|uniref:hypothetical protein n=1 Tax=Catellicoccus marimammalium TaxID=300419 RepID=UPI00058B4775|nr:hypothetical protein [Catellicoccus marimammalium]